MYVTNPKKMNILLILEVLKTHSDENNKLSQKMIASLVEREYGVPVDRHTLKRNLDNLYDFHCGVEYAVPVRNRDAPGRNEPGGWYFEREITDAELRMLIDGLLFSKYIPYSECKELTKKLERMASVDFKHSHGLPENRPENKEIFLNIEELLHAMSTRKKVAFNYLRYGPDKVARLRLKEDGTPRRYIASPYEIVITNGRYYLICSHDNSEKIFHYRLDSICGVEVLKSEKRRSIRELPGFEGGLKLAKYMQEHPYMMYSGDKVRVTFRTDTYAIGQVIDWFGKDVQFEAETENTAIAAITVNERAMFHWALQYGVHVEVLEPQSLRDRLRDAIVAMGKKYSRDYSL